MDFSRLTESVVEIEITDKEYSTALSYAKKVVSTVNYGDSNQANYNKIRRDHFVGKVGEIAVKKFFESHKQRVNGPDFKIYRGRKKSWDSDLRVNGVPIAVKTQSFRSAKRYGLSWTFQESLSRRDKILDTKDAWVCFVMYKVGEGKCYVFPPRQMSDIVPVFKDPKVKFLVGKKKVVYAEDAFPWFSFNELKKKK